MELFIETIHTSPYPSFTPPTFPGAFQWALRAESQLVDAADNENAPHSRGRLEYSHEFFLAEDVVASKESPKKNLSFLKLPSPAQDLLISSVPVVFRSQLLQVASPQDVHEPGASTIGRDKDFKQSRPSVSDSYLSYLHLL